MKRNKLKVLSSLAILGIAGLGLAACSNNTGSGTTPSPTPTPTDTGSGATTTPTPTPAPTTPGQTTTTTPNQSSTNTPDQNQIESISVSGQTKEFLPGSEFVFGGTVTKNYSDGSQVVATEEEYIVTIYTDSSYETEVEDKNIKAAGTYYVVVSIGDKLATYEIVVREAQQTIHELTDFDSLATGDVSEAKELYNQNNNKVSLTANATSGIKIDKSGESYNDLKFAQRLNFKGQTIKGQTEPVSNGVVADGIVSITVANPCTIKVYAKSSGDQKRPIRLTNTADYTKDVLTTTKSSLGCNEFKIETAGTYYLYQTDVDKNNYPVGESESTLKNGGLYIYGIGIEYDVPVSSVTYSEIKVDAKNAITDFNKGDTFVTTGLIVTGLNNYGVWDVLDSADYTVTNEDGSIVDTTTVGRKTLKVTAKGHSDTYDIQVMNPNAAIESIVVKEEPKTVYKKGEEISLSGLTITSTDSDSLTQDIAYDAEKITYRVLNGETDVTSQFTTLTKGTYSVELTYASKTTTYDIAVLEVKEKVFTSAALTCVSVGTTSFNITGAKYTVTYTDGTDKAYDSQTDTITDLVVSWYADATTNSKSDFASLTASAGTIYYTLGYGDDVSVRYAVTVEEAGNTYTNEFDAVQYYKDQNYTASQTIKSATVVGNIFTLHSDMRIKSDGLSANKVKSAFGDKKNNCIEFDVRNNFTGKLSISLARTDRYVYLYKVDGGTLTEVGKIKETGDIENLEAGKYVIFFNEKDQTQDITEPKITKLTLVETKNAE